MVFIPSKWLDYLQNTNMKYLGLTIAKYKTIRKVVGSRLEL